jgi:hypothetical protein
MQLFRFIATASRQIERPPSAVLPTQFNRSPPSDSPQDAYAICVGFLLVERRAEQPGRVLESDIATMLASTHEHANNDL